MLFTYAYVIVLFDTIIWDIYFRFSSFSSTKFDNLILFHNIIIFIITVSSISCIIKVFLYYMIIQDDKIVFYRLEKIVNLRATKSII